MTQVQTDAGYLVSQDTGVVDVWWPYQPQVGRYTVKIGSDQSGAALAQMLVRDRRGGAPPLHVHHREDETFYVVSGEITFFVGDEQLEAGAGDFVFAPKGVPHSFLVKSEQAEYLASFTPAGAERFFAEVAPHVAPGEPAPPAAPPDSGEFARIAGSYGIEILGPPPTLD